MLNYKYAKHYIIYHTQGYNLYIYIILLILYIYKYYATICEKYAVHVLVEYIFVCERPWQELRLFLCWDSTSEASVQSVAQSLEVNKTAEIDNKVAKEFMCLDCDIESVETWKCGDMYTHRGI